jgi:outer membrane protein, multidrug efflux system
VPWAEKGFGVVALWGGGWEPDSRKPGTTVPAAWHSMTPAVTPTSVATPGEAAVAEWWKSFNDPMLTSLIERAVQSNLDVKLAQARIRQARASRGVAFAGLWPEIDASADYSYNRGGSASSGSSTAGGRAYDLFQAGLDTSWEFDFF